jgi:hypothetical protein
VHTPKGTQFQACTPSVAPSAVPRAEPEKPMAASSTAKTKPNQRPRVAAEMTGAFRVAEDFNEWVPAEFPEDFIGLLSTKPIGCHSGQTMLEGNATTSRIRPAVHPEVKLERSKWYTEPGGAFPSRLLEAYRSTQNGLIFTLEALSYPLSVANVLLALQHRAAAAHMLSHSAASGLGFLNHKEIHCVVIGASRLAEQRIYEDTTMARVLRTAFPAASVIRVLLTGHEIQDDKAYDPATALGDLLPTLSIDDKPITSSSAVHDTAFGRRWLHAGWRAPSWHQAMSNVSRACPVVISAAKADAAEVLKAGHDASLADTFLATTTAFCFGVCHHGGFGNRWPKLRETWAPALHRVLESNLPFIFASANRPEIERGELPIMARIFGARILLAGKSPSHGVMPVIGDPATEMKRLGLRSPAQIVDASLDSSVCNYFCYAVQGFRFNADRTRCAVDTALRTWAQDCLGKGVSTFVMAEAEGADDCRVLVPSTVCSIPFVQVYALGGKPMRATIPLDCLLPQSSRSAEGVPEHLVGPLSRHVTWMGGVVAQARDVYKRRSEGSALPGDNVPVSRPGPFCDLSAIGNGESLLVDPVDLSVGRALVGSPDAVARALGSLVVTDE